MFNILLILGLYSITILLAEALFYVGVKSFITRKIAHIMSGIISAILPVFLDLRSVFIVGAILGFGVIITKLLEIFRSVELEDHFSWGTLFFPLGMLVCAYFFYSSPIIFSSSMLILGFADSFAALIGRYYGKKQYKFIDTKSYLGSLIFILVSSFIMYLAFYFNFNNIEGFSFFKFGLIVFASTILAVIEGVSAYGLDNLFIPLISAYFLETVLSISY